MRRAWSSLCCILACASAHAQTQVPVLQYLGSAAFTGLPAPDGLATIWGMNMSDAAYSATSLPLPTHLGPTSVQICLTDGGDGFKCQDAPLLYVSPTQINLYMPANDYGSTDYNTETILTVGTQVVSGNVQIAQINPSIFDLGYDCDYDPLWHDTSPCGIQATQAGPLQVQRGAITDLAGNVITSLNPAHLNRYYVLYLTGLGVDGNWNSPFIPASDSTISLTLDPRPNDPLQTPYTVDVAPIYAGESSYVGLQQVNFIVTSEDIAGAILPCGNYRFDLRFQFWQALPFGTVYPDQHSLSLPVTIQESDIVGCSS